MTKLCINCNKIFHSKEDSTCSRRCKLSFVDRLLGGSKLEKQDILAMLA